MFSTFNGMQSSELYLLAGKTPQHKMEGTVMESTSQTRGAMVRTMLMVVYQMSQLMIEADVCGRNTKLLTPYLD